MASAYSILHNYGNPQSNFDFDLIGKVMSYKQQKYDANLAKIDAAYSQLDGVDLARDVDKQYMVERLNNLTNEINSASNNGGLDLSNNSLSRNIHKHLDQVYDDNVMTAIIQTKKLRNYDAQVKQVQKDHPDQYNQANEAFGMRNAISYLNGDQVGETIQGELKYEPYKDIEGDINKIMLEYQKAFKGQTVEVPLGDGQTRVTSISSLTPAEMRNMAIAQLGTKYNKQIEINSWNRNGAYKDPTVVGKALQAYTEQHTEHTNEQIDLLKIQRTREGITDAEKALVDKKIAEYENSTIDLKKNMLELGKSTERAGTFLEKEHIIGAVVGGFSGFYKESVSYKKDESYWAVKEYNYEANQDKIDNNYRERVFAHTQDQDKITNELAERKLIADETAAAAATAAAKAATGLTGGLTHVGDTTNLSVEDVQAKFKEQTGNLDKTYRSNMKDAEAKLKEVAEGGGEHAETAKRYLKTIEATAKLKNNAGLSRESIVHNVLMRDDLKGSKLLKSDIFQTKEGSIIDKGHEAWTLANMMHQEDKRINKKVDDELFDNYIDSESAMERYYSNKNVVLMVDQKIGDASTVKATTVHSLLTAAKVYDPETKKRLKSTKAAMVSIMGERMTLGEALVRNHHVSAALNSTGRSMGGLAVNPNLIDANRRTKEIDALAGLLGEDPNKIYKTVPNPILESLGAYERHIYNQNAPLKVKLDPTSKTYKYLSSGNKLKIRERDLFLDQDLTNDDGPMGQYMKNKLNKNQYQTTKDEYKKFNSEVLTNKAVILGKDSEANKMASDIMDVYGDRPPTGTAIKMSMEDTEAGRQIVFKQIGKDGKDIVPSKATIPLADLLRPENAQWRALLEGTQVDKEKNFSAKVMKGREVESGQITLPDTDYDVQASANYLNGIGYGGKTNLLTKEGVHNQFAMNPSMQGLQILSIQRGTGDIMKVMDALYAKINQFSVSVTADENNQGPEVRKTILYKGEPIVIARVGGKDYADDEVKLTQRHPQVVFGTMIEDMVNQQYSRALRNLPFSEDFNKLIKIANEQ